jgi:hypothetical protein
VGLGRHVPGHTPGGWNDNSAHGGEIAGSNDTPI